MRAKVGLLTIMTVVFFAVPVVFAIEDTTTGTGTAEQTKAQSREEKIAEIKARIEERRAEVAQKRAETKEKTTAKSLEGAKKIAKQKLDSAIKKLEQIKKRVAKMKVVSEADKTALNEKIDARIAVLEAKITELEGATTKEEVRAIIGDSVKELRDTKEIVKEIVEAIHKGHLDAVVTRMESLLAKIEDKIANLDAAKKEEAEETVLQIEALLASAKESITAGEYSDAKASLKDARKEFTKIVKILKAKNASAGTKEDSNE